MRDEIVAYLENRVQELMKEANEAENKEDVISAKCAIEKAIEVNMVEIEVNNIEILETKKKIEKIIAEREKSA